MSCSSSWASVVVKRCQSNAIGQFWSESLVLFASSAWGGEDVMIVIGCVCSVGVLVHRFVGFINHHWSVPFGLRVLCLIGLHYTLVPSSH